MINEREWKKLWRDFNEWYDKEKEIKECKCCGDYKSAPTWAMQRRKIEELVRLKLDHV
jgi:hypothetical protein